MGFLFFTDYRNVQIFGPALATYYDSENNKLIFNGLALIEDKKKSIVLSEKGKLAVIK